MIFSGYRQTGSLLDLAKEPERSGVVGGSGVDEGGGFESVI